MVTESSRKEWIKGGVYDNRKTMRRETYDNKGNVIVSAGYLYVNSNPGPYGKFGSLLDIPVKPRD